MATPKPGEIRCPTCHRSTPPAGFCTQCGSVIPTDARIRPRGLDRDELQERIRARRSGGEPYRRGGAAGGGLPGYERFQPEPEDRAARRAAPDAPRPDLLSEAPPPFSPAAATGAPPDRDDADSGGRGAPAERPDLTREDEEWAPSSTVVTDPVPAVVAAPYMAPVEDYRELDEADRPAYIADGEDDEYGEYAEWNEEPRGRRSAGAGALAILGFLALGVLALLAGAVLAGVFGDDPQTGVIDTSPSPVVSSAPAATNSPEQTPEPSVSGSSSPSLAPPASGAPTVFPDGFTAEVQPCLPGSADLEGCDSNGASNAGALDIWVGFTNGTGNDVISAEVRVPGDAAPIGAGTIDLADIGCRSACPGGWTYFPFSDLAPGTYEVLVTRNGQPAGTASFVVS